MPTEYLSQVSKGWPYAKFGVGRRSEVKTWGLTDGEGRTVTEVRHRVLWWPKPLWNGEIETEVLESWRPTFAMPEGWVAPSVVNSSSASSRTSSGAAVSNELTVS